MEIIDCLTEEVLTQILNINSLQELLNYIKKKVEINLLPIYKFPVQILVNSDTYFSYLRESKKIHPNIVVIISPEKKEFYLRCVNSNISLIIKTMEGI